MMALKGGWLRCKRLASPCCSICLAKLPRGEGLWNEVSFHARFRTSSPSAFQGRALGRMFRGPACCIGGGEDGLCGQVEQAAAAGSEGQVDAQLHADEGRQPPASNCPN